MDIFLWLFPVCVQAYLLQPLQASNDWLLRGEILNTSINEILNQALYPTHDITQIDVMNVICSVMNFSLEEIAVKTNESDNWNDTLSLEYDVVLTVVIDMLEIQVAQPVMIVIGIIGNLITMMYILVNKKLQKPFYYCIVNFALGDIISLLSNPYCRKISIEFFPGLCSLLNFMFIFEAVRQSSNLFSGLGVLILGYVRYLLFARPFQGIKYLTKARVRFSFCLSSVLSGVYGYFTAKVLYSSRGFQYVIISSLVDGVSLILLLIILIFFFCHRFKAAQTSVSARDTKLPMTIVTIIILALNTLKFASSLVNNIRFFLPEYRDIMLNSIETYFIIVNIVVHSVNPLIYFCKYTTAKRIWKACFFCSK